MSVKDVQQPIVPTHILGTTGTGAVADIGFRELSTFKGDLGLGTSLTNLTVSGTLGVTGVGTIQGLTIGRGAGSISSNTAVGASALAANTTGNKCTATGGDALRNNETGINNTANGFDALLNNETGSGCTAIGQAALRECDQENNTAIGVSALRNTTTGPNNTASGVEALYDNSTGLGNTGIGYKALRLNGIGSINTAIGFEALSTTTIGINNTGIGNGATASTGTVNNTVTLGNSAITTLRCQVTTITSLSDARDKTNIKEIPAGLSFIQALRPVSFDWNMRDGGKVGVPEFGFIAQELQTVQADTGVTVPNLVYDDNPEKLEAGYGVLIPVLVKAIQELKAEVDSLKSQL